MPQPVGSVRAKVSDANWVIPGKTVSEALTVVPVTVPSLGVTSTLTVSPGSPLPGPEVQDVGQGRCIGGSLPDHAVDPPDVGQRGRVAIAVGARGRGGQDGVRAGVVGPGRPSRPECR